MAYPFGPAIRWQELIAQLQRYDIELKQEQFPPEAWDQNQPPMRYLESKDGTFMAVCIDSEDDHVAWSSIRSICDLFGLDHADFGLDLDHPD